MGVPGNQRPNGLLCVRAGPALTAIARCTGRALPPGEEGTAWWAGVISCLAETPDPAQRRRYLRTYRRSVPQLVWTS